MLIVHAESQYCWIRFLKLSFEQIYPETFAEQCKYREKERKTINFIDKEIGWWIHWGRLWVKLKNKQNYVVYKWHSSSFECHSSRSLRELLIFLWSNLPFHIIKYTRHVSRLPKQSWHVIFYCTFLACFVGFVGHTIGASMRGGVVVMGFLSQNDGLFLRFYVGCDGDMAS